MSQSASFSYTLQFLTAIPGLPSAQLATTSCADVQVYLHQLGDTGGSCVLPPAVVRVLNSKACRSAIMFGDPLLPTECAELIAALKITQLCFCCAHGRPTMAPLINIAAYEQHLATAHGLQAPHNLSMLPVKWKDGLKQKLQLLVSKSP